MTDRKASSRVCRVCGHPLRIDEPAFCSIGCFLYEGRMSEAVASVRLDGETQVIE